MRNRTFDFYLDGARLYSGAVRDIIGELCALFDGQPRDIAGVRLHGIEALRPFVGIEGRIGAIAASIIGPNSRAVRAILFDKTAETNWSLGWHQDRTICVRKRVAMEGFGPWTVKGGMQHVAPPFDLLSRMVTLRVHLDDVPQENAPLMIVPGSHNLGRIPEANIEGAVARFGHELCLAKAGDIWAYATPILHGSKAATRPARRRVLQIDFSGDDLPGELEWLGV